MPSQSSELSSADTRLLEERDKNRVTEYAAVPVR